MKRGKTKSYKNKTFTVQKNKNQNKCVNMPLQHKLPIMHWSCTFIWK